ncbi:hypothetical protein Tco_1404125 [Tanacetum coccineum]
MDDPNITMEEYIMLEEENARKHRKVFNWETAKISFDESDDEDYMVVFDKNSFSYKIISTNDLKMDSENDNDKINMPSPESEVSYFDDLDFFKDFENEFPAIVYNDALMSKSDFLTEPIVSPQHIDEFDLKDETSLSECEKEEQNVLYFNDLFPFKVIYPDDSKSDKDNDDDKIDIEHSLGDMSVVPLPNVINTDDGDYAQYNYEVTCEEEAKRSNSGTKTKTFEESTKTASIRRIHEGRYDVSAPAHHKKHVLINSLYGVSTAYPYAVLTAVTSVKDLH